MMQRWILGAGLVSALGIGAAQQPTHDDVAEVESFLFVQNSTSGTYDGERLTLNSVAPTIFISDRPYRIYGHVELGAFVEAWKRGPNSFAEDPPNAILSLLGEEHVASFEVELLDPRVEAQGVSYGVVVEHGTIPPSFEASSLFIDNEAWAAVGGLVVGHRMARRQDARTAAAYEAGAAKGRTSAQTSSYYYNAAPPPPPPPPPQPAAGSPQSVTSLLEQATQAMDQYASKASEQDRQYIEKLVQTVKTVADDYGKVAK